jgi:predicted DNA-binding transcriptional regulator AlpA
MKSLLNVREAAAHTNLSKSTLDKWRCKGVGPRFIRLGKRRIAYALADLDRWMSERTHSCTAEYLQPDPGSPTPS